MRLSGSADTERPEFAAAVERLRDGGEAQGAGHRGFCRMPTRGYGVQRSDHGSDAGAPAFLVDGVGDAHLISLFEGSTETTSTMAYFDPTLDQLDAELVTKN